MKIVIDRNKPLSKKSLDAIWKSFKDRKSLIYQFVEDQDKADFLLEKAEIWAKIGSLAGGLIGAVVEVVTLCQGGNLLGAYGAFQACVSLGMSLGYGIGLLLGLILWRWRKGFNAKPLFDWFGLAPNRVKLIPT